MQELSFHKKIIGLSLLRTVGFNDAVKPFADVLNSSFNDARLQLTHLSKKALFNYWGLIEEVDNKYYLYQMTFLDDPPSSNKKVLLDEEFLERCNAALRLSLVRSINMLREKNHQ